MSQINTRLPTSHDAAIRELNAEELDLVSGGFPEVSMVALAGGAVAAAVGVMAGAASHAILAGWKAI
jgi:hypothetical protein